eukprot:jgi/Tetstr1/424556/TSEL_015082.t1
MGRRGGGGGAELRDAGREEPSPFEDKQSMAERDDIAGEVDARAMAKARAREQETGAIVITTPDCPDQDPDFSRGLGLDYGAAATVLRPDRREPGGRPRVQPVRGGDRRLQPSSHSRPSTQRGECAAARPRMPSSPPSYACRAARHG